MGSSIAGHAPHVGHLNEQVNAFADGTGALGERAAGAVSPLLERVIEFEFARAAGDNATRILL